MAEFKYQPDKEKRKALADLALSKRLNKFADLALIGKFAQHFSKHPDEVFTDTSFATLTAFSIYWKEREEYAERINYFYKEVNANPNAADRGAGAGK